MTIDHIAAMWVDEILFQTWMAWLDDENSVAWLNDSHSTVPDRFYVMYGGSA